MLRTAALAAAFASLYFLTAKLTGWLIPDPAVLWPASGVYLGVMLVAPRHLWSVLACAAFAGSLVTYLHGGASLGLSVAFAVPSSAEGLLAALLVERIAGRRFALAGGRDVLALVVGGAIVANGLVALSAAAVAAQAFDASFAESWLRWWSADALGMLAVVPIMTFAAAARERERLRVAADHASHELEGSAERLERADRRSARLTAELAARSAEVHDATRKRERVAADLRDLQAARDRTERELAEARRELSRMSTDNGTLEEELSRVTAQNGALEEALSRVGRHNGALEEELSRVSSQNGALEEELSRVSSRNGALEEELSRVSSQAGGLEEELSRVSSQAGGLEEELSRVSSRNAALEEELSHAGRQNRALEEELSRGRAERRALQQEVESVRPEQARIREELAGALSDRERLEQALEKARALLLEERTRLEQSLDEVTATLARTEAERRLLADHATELIARYDERGTCLYASPASRRLLGYEPEELVAHAGAELLHPEDRHLLARARAARSESTFQARLRRKAGDYVWVEVRLRPVLAHDGDRVVAVNTTIRGIARDRDLAAA